MTIIYILTIISACLFNIFLHLYFHTLVEKWFQRYDYIIQTTLLKLCYYSGNHYKKHKILARDVMSVNLRVDIVQLHVVTRHVIC